MDTQTLNIAQFNDVYQVNEQKIQVDGKEESIDVTKFASSLNNVTSKWDTNPDRTKDGLIIFSGDSLHPDFSHPRPTHGEPCRLSSCLVNVNLIIE